MVERVSAEVTAEIAEARVCDECGSRRPEWCAICWHALQRDRDAAREALAYARTELKEAEADCARLREGEKVYRHALVSADSFLQWYNRSRTGRFPISTVAIELEIGAALTPPTKKTRASCPKCGNDYDGPVSDCEDGCVDPREALSPPPEPCAGTCCVDSLPGACREHCPSCPSYKTPPGDGARKEE